ncbi:MAG TPA: CPBP family intramembrane glutamic endopeptidase [Gemmatimonadales bacterium]|nr:CPBP family intramembrane glutamic endopeptidase [Gemmatimonadales bacterium]
MTARAAFLERAKAIGVALAWIVAFGIVGGVASWTLARLARPTPSWSLAWVFGTAAAGFGLATWLVGRRLDHRSWKALGWRPGTGCPFGLTAGVACGAVMAVAAIALAVLGGATVHWTAAAAPWGAVALPLAAALIVAALVEELMFRGYPLRRLADAIGAAPATAVSALAFGLAHVANPSATLLSTVNVALAGAWLACAFFSPGAMPLAWGAHFGWNATLALAFDAPVSGFVFGVPGIAYHPGPYAWLDGRAFGPEGGVVTTVVMIAGVATLAAWARRGGTGAGTGTA